MIIDSVTNKRKILKNFIDIAAKYGWNQNSLLRAMDKAQIDRKYLSLIFPNLILDVAEFYIELGNNDLEKKINSISGFDDNKIRDKIKICLYERFETEKSNQLVLLSLANYYRDPKNLLDFENGLKPAMQSLKFCFNVADKIWILTKDQSTDHNYYSKRIILAKILVGSFYVFLKDDDKNLATTKKFIDNEVDKVMRFEKFKFKTKDALTDFKESVEDIFVDKSGSLKNVQQIFDNLPFIRLLKNK